MKSHTSLGISKWKGDFGYIKDTICKLPGIYLSLTLSCGEHDYGEMNWASQIIETACHCFYMASDFWTLYAPLCSSLAGTHARTLIWGDRIKVIKSPDWVIGNWVLARLMPSFFLVSFYNKSTYLIVHHSCYCSILRGMSPPVSSLWKIKNSLVWGNIWRLHWSA